MISAELKRLFGIKQTLIAIEAPLTERNYVFKEIYQAIQHLDLPLFYWNRGFEHWHSVKIEPLTLISQASTNNGIQWLFSNEAKGVYIIDGLLAADNATGILAKEKLAALSNLAFKLMSDNPSQWVIFLESYLELPMEIAPLIEVLKLSFPNYDELSRLILNFCFSKGIKTQGDELERLVRASRAIGRGELEIVLPRLSKEDTNALELANSILNYKKQKFKGQGVEFISAPDVPFAAGLELLDEALSLCAALLKPEAATHNLTFPKGMLLWGIPGTGKSLSAKLAANKIGVPLVACDWGGLIGNNAYESRKNLKEFLFTCDILGEEGLIIYFDDFDKGFAGYDSTNDGGLARQLASKLLTWMQEHTSKVLVLATINKLSFLPPELIRRFEENIFFVDLPHAGARYQIFKLHLAKYFRELDFEEKDWRRLLAETHLLTPAEIGNLVKRTASIAFYQNVQAGESNKTLSITVSDLIEQRYKFTPSAIRDEDQIVTIRNLAGFARPGGKKDDSVWARKTPPLFEN